MMKLLVDMNLTPRWVHWLNEHEIEAAHWSSIGRADAKDREIMKYAREHHYVVFTHDLDFGTLLAATDAEAPSVIQIRSEDTTPGATGSILLKAIKQFTSYLEQGALVTVDPSKVRVRILPLYNE